MGLQEGDYNKPDVDTSGLDGLRGIAALIVVLSHTSNEGMKLLPFLDFSGIGKIGVWLFFVLSAYLLTGQLMQSGRPLARDTLTRFFIRRFFRIYPLFAVALIVDYLLGRTTGPELGVGLALFEAKGIFWTVPVEVQFYFLVPVIAFVFLRLRDRLLLIVAFSATLFAGSVLLKSHEFDIGWNYVCVFIVGSFAAFASPCLESRGHLLGLLALASAALIAITAPAMMAALGLAAYGDNVRSTPYLYGPLWACVVLASIYSIPWRRALQPKGMRMLGEISFSLYLLHPWLIEWVKGMQLSPPLAFLCVLGGAVTLSAIVYAVLEYPSRRLGYLLTGGTPRRPRPMVAAIKHT